MAGVDRGGDISCSSDANYSYQTKTKSLFPSPVDTVGIAGFCLEGFLEAEKFILKIFSKK